MAEFVMKDMVKKAGLEDRFEIASAATSTEELGNPVYPPAKRMLASHGLRCDGKYSRQVTKKDYGYYDRLICMDQRNLRNLERIIGPDTEHKVSLLLDYAGMHRDVADPWYTGDFEATWEDVNAGCKGLLEQLR